MNLQQIDLNLFRVFDVIYRERNISRAARLLNITQPAASNALQRLRDRLGDQLFYRAGGGVAPTPVAQALIVPVRQALQLLESGIQQHRTFEPATSRQHFRIGLNDLGEAILMPRLLQIVRAEAPHVSIQSIAVSRGELAQELNAGNLDMAIHTPGNPDPQLSHTQLLKDRYICLLRPGHPILDQPWQLDTFLQLEHVHPSSRRSGGGLVDIALDKLGRTRRVALRAQHYMVAPQIVRETDLALCVPQRFGALFPDLVALELPFHTRRLEFHLFQREGTQTYGAYQWLRAKFQAVIASGESGQ